MEDIRTYLVEFRICSKKHLAFIEIIRVAAIFFVVFIHVVESLGRQYSPLALLADLSGRFFVPLLLMISGFLLGYKYHSQNNFQKKLQNDIQNSIEIDPQMGLEKIGFDRSRFLQSKIYGIAVPFIIWNIIYVTAVIRPGFRDLFSWHVLFLLATGFVHLYFVFVLLQLFLVYIFLYPKNADKKGQFIFCAISILLTLLLYLFSEWDYSNNGADNHYFEWTFGKFFIGWMAFFFLGILIGAHRDLRLKLGRHMWLFLMIAILIFPVYYYQEMRMIANDGYLCREYFRVSGFIYQFFAALFVLLYSESFFESNQKKNLMALRDSLAALGNDSFGVYLNHFLFIMLVLYLLNALMIPDNFCIRFMLMMPIVLALSWLSVKAFKTNTKLLARIGHLLYGRR